MEHRDMMRAAQIYRRIAKDAEMQFLAVPAEDIADFPFGEAAALANNAPLFVFLEPGAWSATKEDVSEDLQEVQQRVAVCMNRFDPEHPVVLGSVVTKIESFAKPLRQVGLFDRYFSLPPAAHSEIGANFLNLIGEDYCSHMLRSQTDKVGQFVYSEYDEHTEQNLAALALRRLAVEDSRPIEFVDLMRMCVANNALVETPGYDHSIDAGQTACHEAGHAVMVYVMSEGRNIPEYTSILPVRDCKGLVVESYTYALIVGNRMNFNDFVAKVRMSLAGRAAEELVYGPTGITRGSESDLANATRLAMWAFTECGYCPGMAYPDGNSGANLMVLGDNPSHAYISEIEQQIRDFLASQYQKTIEILREHRSLLDTITQRLLLDQFVSQAEMTVLCKNA